MLLFSISIPQLLHHTASNHQNCIHRPARICCCRDVSKKQSDNATPAVPTGGVALTAQRQLGRNYILTQPLHHHPNLLYLPLKAGKNEVIWSCDIIIALGLETLVSVDPDV